MSGSITKEQQAEIQHYQQMTQQLSTLHQNYLQMENRKRELEKTLSSIADKDAQDEIYRKVGQVLFKTDVESTKKELTEELELLEVRVNRSKKQIEELDKRVKDKEAQLRASIQ